MRRSAARDGFGNLGGDHFPDVITSPLLDAFDHGDANADGRVDLLVAADDAPPRAAWMFGNGLGGFSQGPWMTPPGAGGTGIGVVAAQVDGDASVDILLYGAAGSTMSLWLGLGDGQGGVSQWTTLPLPSGLAPVAVEVLDMNGDNLRDLAVLTGTLGSPAALLLLQGDGLGGFTLQKAILPDPSAAPGFSASNGLPRHPVAGSIRREGLHRIARVPDLGRGAPGGVSFGTPGTFSQVPALRVVTRKSAGGLHARVAAISVPWVMRLLQPLVDVGPTGREPTRISAMTPRKSSRRSRPRTLPATALLLLGFVLLGPPAAAQFNQQWLSMTQNNSLMKNPSGTAHSQLTDTREKDYAVADVDSDGDQDLAVVRKVPAGFPGKEVNYLFLNENGVLIDRTAQYAANSTTPGDLGFNRPTDSRDAEFGDFNNDGWLDFLETNADLTNQTTAAAKITTHPRVYMNLQSFAGVWNGLRHEDSRIPQLHTAAGINGVVRFCDSTLGDIDGDGDLDLYFIDHDTDQNGHPEPSNLDLNDRLLINDGNGFFTDATALKMNSSMSSSAFGTECVFTDINGDGRLDLLKISTLVESPNRVEAIYNDADPTVFPNGGGNFDVHQTNVYTGEVYTMSADDLNNDGRVDIAAGDDSTDGYKFNLGGTPSVTWSGKLPFTWLSGSGSQSSPGQMYTEDYNCDGWKDVLITDVDIDLLGCNRRTQIYHNRQGIVGASNIVLAEEKQQSGTGGWFGLPGWSSTYPRGVFDAANIDLDGDGDLEIILGRCSGTDIWVNNTKTVDFFQPVVAQGCLGNANLTVFGPPLATGVFALLSITGGPANGVALLFVSFSVLTTPLTYGSGKLWTFPVSSMVKLPLDASGSISFLVPGGGGPVSAFVQAIVGPAPCAFPPTGFTPVVRIDFLP